MNILLVSNNDMCRSRMAQKILSSFGHGIKIFTSGVLPGRVIPSSVVGVMEQNGYDCSRKKASDVDIIWQQIMLFCTAFGIAYGIQLLFVILMIEAIGIKEFTAQFIGIIIYGAVNFMVNNRITFR